MVNISIQGLTVKFGDFTAVDNMDLEIKHGEIMTLLGPSGCGKTTTLRALTGFNKPASGRIFFDDKDITDYTPQRRETGLVPQTYAVWPHMSVFKNVEYGLRLRKVPTEERKRRVEETLEMVDMKDQISKLPSELSGGQQQRVALARALVIEPAALFCDEPLSNLDHALRLKMRVEIREMVKELGLTTIWVTHDQEEALSLSDRITVMNFGVIHQTGDPISVYRDPADLFVAQFIGEANSFVGTVDDGSLKLPSGAVLDIGLPKGLADGSEATAVIRYEQPLLEDIGKTVELQSEVVHSVYMGRHLRVTTKLEDGTPFVFQADPHYLGKTDFDTGSKISAFVRKDDFRVYADNKRIEQ